MNVLPKPLFLFQCLPIFLSKSFFTSIDSTVSHFLWNGKTPRVRLKVLQSCKFNGCLSLPNFRVYYWATNISKTIFWLEMVNIPWCQLEIQSCPSSSLLAILAGVTSVNPSGFTNNPVVISTLKIWFQFRKHFKFLTPTISSPLLRNYAFKPAVTDSVFTLWHDKGLKCFKDFYKDGIFCSFTDLSTEFKVGDHLFRYFQIRNCVKSLFPNFPQLPPEQTWDSLLRLNVSQRSLNSKVYGTIQSYDDHLTIRTKEAWEREFGLTFDADWWELVWNGIYKASICARLTLIQFKVVFRCHYSKTQLSPIFPNIIDVCDRCSGSHCNLAHMFFLFPSLGNIWQTYFDTMSKVLLKTIDVSPHVAIFGTPPERHRFSSGQLEVLAFTSLIVRRHLLLYWKATNIIVVQYTLAHWCHVLSNTGKN